MQSIAGAFVFAFMYVCVRVCDLAYVGAYVCVGSNTATRKCKHMQQFGEIKYQGDI